MKMVPTSAANCASVSTDTQHERQALFIGEPRALERGSETHSRLEAGRRECWWVSVFVGTPACGGQTTATSVILTCPFMRQGLYGPKLVKQAGLGG